MRVWGSATTCSERSTAGTHNSRTASPRPTNRMLNSKYSVRSTQLALELPVSVVLLMFSSKTRAQLTFGAIVLRVDGAVVPPIQFRHRSHTRGLAPLKGRGDGY